DGNERWKWDHYAQYKEPPEVTKAHERERVHPGSYDMRHYGGNEVAVAGKKVVTGFGWDIVCLEDTGKEPKFLWCNRAGSGKDGAIPVSCSVSGDWIYSAGMGADGYLAVVRYSRQDGQIPKDGIRSHGGFPCIPPAVRGSAVALRQSANAINLIDLD